MILQVGVTPEGVKVVANTFKMFDAHGLPLDIMLDLMKENNMIPDWIDFYKEATASGWKDKTIRNRVHTAVSTVYGDDFGKIVLSRLNSYIDNLPD
jgi:alanyl-tRNA synthetase